MVLTRQKLLLSALLLGLFGVASPLGSAIVAADAGEGDDKPRLLLILTIDQARQEYLERFRPVMTGGLKQILDYGVQFTNARHDHALTSTSPGHATLSTGLHPSHSGIISNNWYDRRSKKPVYSVQDSDAPILLPQSRSSTPSSAAASSGRSPRNLLASTLSDWIKDGSPTSKVFAAGGKDRSAILIVGKKADAAYWYHSGSGQFVTSRYYMRDYPEWAQQFHEAKVADSYFGKAWEPLPVKPAVYQELGIEALDRGMFYWSLPHPIGEAQFVPTSSFYSALYRTPYLDGLLADFAQALVAGENLGRDDNLDVLGLCFSSVDAVGHEYGPYSPEVLDAILRLDRSLGELFRMLDRTIGMDRIVIALSADHGVMPLPEYLRSKNLAGKRYTTEDVVCIQSTEKKLDAKLGKEDWVLRDLYLDYEAVARRNLRREDVENELAGIIEQCSAVEKVWTRTQLESPPPHADPFFHMYLHSFYSERSPDLFVQPKKFHLSRVSSGTTHGTPYDYDSHVPLIVVFPGVPSAEVTERVHTVDLAPTLASLLGVPVPDDLDGVDRAELMTPGSNRN